ncbi:MAG: DUF167 domain-containing protein [Gemmatimonadaceae bacterium]
MGFDLARPKGVWTLSAHDPFQVREIDGRVRFLVRVQPRASRNEVVGAHGDAVKIRLTAPPVDGAANDKLVIFLSELLAVGRHSIMIVSGETSRSKLIEVSGITERAVRSAFSGAVAKP